MNGLSNKPSLRDRAYQAADDSEPSLDAWARSEDRGGNVDGTKHVAYIQNVSRAIQLGQISEEGALNLAKRVKGLAPFILPAIGDKRTSMQSNALIRQFVNEGQPERPATPEQIMPEGVLGPPQQATPGAPAVPPREDYAGLSRAAFGRGNFELATQARVQGGLDKSSGKGMYGGIRTGIIPGTNQLIEYGVDEASGTVREVGTNRALKRGVDYEPTVSMGFQNVVGPGGVNQIVQVPARGAIGKPPIVSPTGLQPDKNFTTETAGKLRMVDQGMADIERARGLVFDEKGKLKKGVLFGAKIPGTAGIGEESRMLFSAVENAINAKYRAETGAAGNNEEVKSITRRFTPSVLDSEKSAADKFDRLEEYLSTTYDLVDPGKTYPRISTKPKPRGQASTATNAPSSNSFSKDEIMKEIQKRRAEGKM